MFITYYFRINHKLVRKTYPLPRIGKKMQKLGGFQYATAFGINMGYCTIRFLPASQDIMMIVTEFGKFRYNCIDMRVYASGDILRAKVDDLLGDIEGVKHISMIY